MADYVSKYTGAQIDEAVGKALEGTATVTDESIKTALGYTPADAAKVLLKEDKAAIALEVMELIDASSVAQVVVDENKNITLSGDLADGAYTLKYLNDDGSTTTICTLTISGGTGEGSGGTEEPDEPDTPVTPTYTNLVETALTHTDLSTVYNGGKGYMDGKYASSASPFTGDDSTTVCTGLIPANANSVFYIKGVTFDESNSHFRFGFATVNASNALNAYKVADPESMPDAMTVEELGTQYYKVSMIASYVTTTWPDLKYMWFSAVGTGANLIVTANEPIE